MSVTPVSVFCPYCGEHFETVLDLSAGGQSYFEDCYVCCRPIEFQVNVAPDGSAYNLALRRDDD